MNVAIWRSNIYRYYKSCKQQVAIISDSRLIPVSLVCIRVLGARSPRQAPWRHLTIYRPQARFWVLANFSDCPCPSGWGLRVVALISASVNLHPFGRRRLFTLWLKSDFEDLKPEFRHTVTALKIGTARGSEGNGYIDHSTPQGCSKGNQLRTLVLTLELK